MNPVNKIAKKKDWNGVVALISLSLIYLLYSYMSFGIRKDQLMLLAFVNGTYLLNGIWRRFILAFAIYIVYWIIFDSMKLFPNYRFTEVNIENLYDLEKSIFGFLYSGKIVTPNEYFVLNHNTFLDVLSAFFYLSWVPAPLIFSFYLFKKYPSQFLRFALAFFLTNIIGFILYYIYPAAPPWYVELHGFELDENTKSYAAGLIRFDLLSGTQLFQNMYSKGSNVFAAMPSLHAAYPVIAFYYSYKFRHRIFSVVFFVFIIGIWFAAVYLTHHYILDVIAGLLCAVFSMFLFERIILKQKFSQKFLLEYEKLISKP
jgi:membrane-associated phospholipid phosphatase